MPGVRFVRVRPSCSSNHVPAYNSRASKTTALIRWNSSVAPPITSSRPSQNRPTVYPTPAPKRLDLTMDCTCGRANALGLHGLGFLAKGINDCSAQANDLCSSTRLVVLTSLDTVETCLVKSKHRRNNRNKRMQSLRKMDMTLLLSETFYSQTFHHVPCHPAC